MKTVTQTRHERLLELIAQMGSVQAFADKVGASHSQISQLKSRSKHSNTGKPRTIGNDMARRIEIAFGKPNGWMDSIEPRDQLENGRYSPTEAGAPPIAQQPTPGWWPFPMIDPRRIDALPEGLRGSLEVTLLDALERLEQLHRKQRAAA